MDNAQTSCHPQVFPKGVVGVSEEVGQPNQGELLTGNVPETLENTTTPKT